MQQGLLELASFLDNIGKYEDRSIVLDDKYAEYARKVHSLTAEEAHGLFLPGGFLCVAEPLGHNLIEDPIASPCQASELAARIRRFVKLKYTGVYTHESSKV